MEGGSLSKVFRDSRERERERERERHTEAKIKSGLINDERHVANVMN